MSAYYKHNWLMKLVHTSFLKHAFLLPQWQTHLLETEQEHPQYKWRIGICG